MKKIYLFLLAAFALIANASAQAGFEDLSVVSRDGYQVDGDNPLITDAWEQLYGEAGELNPCCDTGEGSEWALLGETKPDEVTNRNSQDFWHSNWHNGDQTAGSHYLQVMMTDDLDPETLIAFVFTRRSADNDHTIEWVVMGTDDPNAAKSECEELAFVETPFSSKTETLMSTVFQRSEYKYLRFYSEKQQGASYGSRGYFHMARFNIFTVTKMEEIDEVRNEFQALYDKYSAYQDDFVYCTGTMPGDYSEEAVQAFMDALDAYLEISDDDLEGMKAWNKRIVETYEAIATTKVLFRGLPSGYYRIKAGMSYNDGEERYMTGYRKNGKIWGYWKTPDLEDPEGNIQALWKITAVTDSTYDVVNMYHKGRFMKVAKSIDVEMTTDEAYKDSLLAFDAAGSDHELEISYVNIRLDMQPANDFFYLHQNGHDSGNGAEAILVGWSNTYNRAEAICGASEWYFEVVPEDEALEIIDGYDDQEAIMKDEFKMMLDKAPDMLEIAIDVKRVPIVTDAAQMTSPYSQNDLGGKDGGNLSDGVLIDGKTDTYWHSVWSSGNNPYPDGKHYLQVEMPADFDASQQIYMRFTRRNTNNNQIIDWSFKGTNDSEAEEGDCEELATFESPWNSSNQTESFKSELFDTKGYKYLRFYNERNNAGSAFFHLSEFQLCYDLDNPKSQYIALGDVAKNLKALIEKFEEYDMEAFDVADYEALKPIYDAFVAKFVDPTALRDAIAANKNAGDKVVAGTDPGFWPDNSTKDALESAIAAAEAYDVAGAYTPEKSEELIAAIEADAKAIDEAPINKVKEGKWYRLRFGTEAEYDQYKWNKDGNAPNYEINNEDPDNPDTLGTYNAGLFGKYVAVAKRENVTFEKADGSETNGSEIVPIAKEDVRLDQSLHAIDLDKLTDPDMALFRFINVGDSAWAIQNKATGLFIHHDVYLSVQPGLFTQTISGYGQNAFFNKTIEGTGKSPLHMAQSQSVLCAWGNESGSGWTDADGRRGSFFVEEVADVAADYAFGDFSMKFTPGDIYGRCYPVPVTLKSDNVELWSVSNIERTPAEEGGANEQVKVTLVKINPAVPAGRPFFFVAKGEMPEEGDEEGVDYQPVIADLSFTFDLVNAPQTSGYLKGTFDSKTINERFLTTGTGHEDQALEWKASGSSVGVNRVYITDIAEGAEPFSRKAEIAEITFDENGVDGIATVIQNVSREGGIYSIDGRYMGKGNLNNLSKLGRGVYILNGTKVTVK